MAGIGRLHTDGYLDGSFDPGAGANDSVYSVAALSDGKELIGGNFTRVNNAPVNRLARLNADGSLDNSFISGSGVDGAVWSIAETADRRILVGGEFTSVTGSQRNNVAQLLADGSVDGGFNTGSGPNGAVYALGVQANGKVLIGGAFSSVNGASLNYFAG